MSDFIYWFLDLMQFDFLRLFAMCSLFSLVISFIRKLV